MHALAQSRLLPGPLAIAAATLAEIRSGELPFQMACTLGHVIGSVAIATILATIDQAGHRVDRCGNASAGSVVRKGRRTKL